VSWLNPDKIGTRVLFPAACRDMITFSYPAVCGGEIDFMEKKIYDLVIIGASAAGSAAAIYASRRHLNFIMVAKDTGGEVALSGEVENWPGIIHTTGIELAKSFNDHVKSYNAPIDEGLSVTSMEQEGKYHIVNAEDGAGKKKTYKSKTVIITSGIHPRLLAITGEKELTGRGVTYCTVCDGPLYKGKTTATVGAGSAALESALMMSEISEKVYLITKYKEDNLDGFPKGENILVKKVKEKKNVEIVYNALTTAIVGDGMVSRLKYKDADSNEEKTIEVQGVMVHIGTIPNSDFVGCASKDKQGQVKVDILCKTDCDGVFAAGDVTNVPYNQIAIAAGQGVTAALSAIDYLNRWSE
jgi:NADH-dependent peroxiredoxin subunit F